MAEDSPSIRRAGGPDTAPELALYGALVRDHAARLRDELATTALGPGVERVDLDLGAVTAIDNAGAAMLAELLERCRARDVTLTVSRAEGAVAERLSQTPEPPRTPQADRVSWLEALGGRGFRWWTDFVGFLSLTADTFILSFAGSRRTRRVRRGATALEAVRIGVDALPIVALILFLVGIVVALQSAYQLRQFGAAIYVADLLSVSLTREMGPLMTAVIIAGRSGASIAAEVATMQVSEEVDALRSMGLSPVRYIVVPKFQAITLTMPALVAFANTVGILGGLIVAALYLDIGPDAFANQVFDALVLKDLLTGLVKSIAFAWIIVLVAAFRGFQARGGAESVGLTTTASVVSSIFWVIVADAGFSMLFYFGG